MSIETGDLRQQQRTRVLMHATVIGADGERRVRVSDLTASGARLAGGHGLNSGSDVIFKRSVLAVAARVAWTSREGAGLEFYRKIDSAALAATGAPPALAGDDPIST